MKPISVVVTVLIGAGVALVVMMAVLWWIHEPEGRAAPPAPSATGAHLQVSPAAELRMLRARERRLLNGFGWVDRRHGRVHIPIEAAMRHLAQQQGETR